MVAINIARDFSRTPGARYKKDGSFSGEEFRETFLEVHFKDPASDSPVQINLDGVEGYATSFLEEAFGGLARKYGVDKVLARLSFVSEEDPLLIDEIRRYIQGANSRA